MKKMLKFVGKGIAMTTVCAFTIVGIGMLFVEVSPRVERIN